MHGVQRVPARSTLQLVHRSPAHDGTNLAWTGRGGAPARRQGRERQNGSGMRGVTVAPGDEGTARLEDLPDPRAGVGECLVRVLEVGVDGTDREIDGGEYGDAPEGEDRLVLGHECLGRVERGCGDIAEGTLVVPTVRRGCPQRCPNCAAGEYDFCATGDYTERGIKGAHGFMADLFTERPEHLIPVPADLRAVAVLVEPLAILERTFRHIDEIQQRLVWTPRRIVLTGAGNMGIMAAFLAGLRDMEILMYSKGEQTGATASILDQVGCEYVDSDDKSLAEATAGFGAPDIVIEGTGFSPLAWDAIDVLAINGIACLLSVTPGEETVEIDSDRLNRRMVLGNRVVFGSVNAHRTDYERARDDMPRIRDRWPGALDSFITHRRSLDDFRAALDEEDPAELKTVLEVADG
jgi:glucose 1-dehydrogenase